MSTRTQVLNVFKRLHRAKDVVFAGDDYALNAARAKINSEFKTNMSLTNAEDTQKLLKLAQNVEAELRTSVIQAQEEKKGVYTLRFTKDTKKLDNVMFDEFADIPSPRKGGSRCKK